ncbi:MAG: DUF4317 family protein [Lachnospiraceae bacterium]|nr:DUF4317 family protein [Lachnospiraceae bacterium]
MINREDMLELTRRMTVKRTHFTRIAGCYVDKDGDFEGSFNRAFGNLTAAEKAAHLALAKAVPFAGTNEELIECRFPSDSKSSQDMWKLLMGIRSCGLKNDALLDTFYDLVMEQVRIPGPYSILLFYGVYDIPLKGSDKQRLEDSESVFEYIICTICPISGDYESGAPFAGFLFPAYAEQSAILSHIDFYESTSKIGTTAAAGIRRLLDL